MITRFSLFLKINESKTNTITLYHGSPYKFDDFKLDVNSSNPQIGSSYFHWFTDDKKVAGKFATTYPRAYYDDKIHIEANYKKELKDKLENNLTIEKEDYNDFLNYLNDNDLADDSYYYQIKDVNFFKENVLDIISGLCMVIGKRNITNSFLKRIITEVESIKNELTVKKNKELETLDNKYKEQPGYLYTVNVTYKSIVSLKGEDIGTNIGRLDEISAKIDEGFDIVKIENADTGMAICNEYAIENTDLIKIISIEEI